MATCIFIHDTLTCDRELTAWSQVEGASGSVRMWLPFPFLTRTHKHTHEHTNTTTCNNTYTSLPLLTSLVMIFLLPCESWERHTMSIGGLWLWMASFTYMYLGSPHLNLLGNWTTALLFKSISSFSWIFLHSTVSFAPNCTRTVAPTVHFISDHYSTLGPKFSGEKWSGGPIFLEFWSPGPKFSPDQNFRDSTQSWVETQCINTTAKYRQLVDWFTTKQHIAEIQRIP